MISIDAVPPSFDAKGNKMAEEVMSVAILEALPGKEEDLVMMLRELYAMMNRKGYCQDWLYRDSDRPDRLVHFRKWKSGEMRREAQIDPDVHRYWQQLPSLCTIPTVYENLETLFESERTPSPSNS
jgi:quinol monooxygenase YgiN